MTVFTCIACGGRGSITANMLLREGSNWALYVSQPYCLCLFYCNKLVCANTVSCSAHVFVLSKCAGGQVGAICAQNCAPNCNSYIQSRVYSSVLINISCNCGKLQPHLTKTGDFGLESWSGTVEYKKFLYVILNSCRPVLGWCPHIPRPLATK